MVWIYFLSAFRAIGQNQTFPAGFQKIKKNRPKNIDRFRSSSLKPHLTCIRLATNNRIQFIAFNFAQKIRLRVSC
jgi:hypothetical protein